MRPDVKLKNSRRKFNPCPRVCPQYPFYKERTHSKCPESERPTPLETSELGGYDLLSTKCGPMTTFSLSFVLFSCYFVFI